MLSFCTLTLLVATALAQYSCVDDYTKDSFADKFNFFTGNDPTNGYVNYVDYNTAQSSGLYNQSNDNVYIGVDHSNVATGSGRNSIRIESKKSYQHGLIILDLEHMPEGACGTWPAFWLLSTSAEWPNGGEVDIIEGVNSQSYNTMAVHTNAGCSISNTGSGMSGQIVTPDCNIAAPNQGTNQGCAIKTSNTQTYGSGFNANGGGVYATEWTSNGISIWFFPRGSIPSDVSSGSPDPSGWGIPLSRFAGNCDWDEKVVNQQIIFDVTFCGDWAGQVFGSDATCSSKSSTCQSYVQANPGAFTDTYWSVNSLKVYQENGAAPTSSIGSVSSTSTASISTTSAITSVSTTSSTILTQTTPSIITTFVTVTTTPASSSTTAVTTSATTTSATRISTTPTTILTTTSMTTSSTTSTTYLTTTSYSTVSTLTTSTLTSTYTTSYIPSSSSSSWQTWTMSVTASIPYAAPIPSSIWNNPSPNTFYTVTKPWGGSPSSWSPPNDAPGGFPGGSGPGGWSGHRGPGGPPKA